MVGTVVVDDGGEAIFIRAPAKDCCAWTLS